MEILFILFLIVIAIMIAATVVRAYRYGRCPGCNIRMEEKEEDYPYTFNYFQCPRCNHKDPIL